MLLLVAFLSYGVFAPQQGFYWDDWVFAWTRTHLGPQGMIQLFAVTRPLRGWLEALLTLLLGAWPVLWQGYAILVHWLAAVACWWFLSVMWPDRRWQASLAALFFLVYPGFTQQPLAMTYHYYWLFTALFFASLGLMVQAVRSERRRRLNYGGAIVLGCLVVWAMEYLFGLEILRVAILWLATASPFKNTKKQPQKIILLYLPFLLNLSLYLYWRLVLYQGTRYSLEGNSLDIPGLASPLFLTWNVLKAIPLVTAGAWLKILQQNFLTQDISLALGFLYAFAFLSIAFGLTYFFKTFQHDPFPSTTGWWEQVVLTILMLLCAGLPFLVVGLPLRLSYPQDRYTLPYALGVSLLLVVLLDLIKNSGRRFTLAALLVSLAVTVQIHNTDVYRKEWQSQRAFLWQLTWRAPNIRPGTTFLAEQSTIFPHNDDEAFAFAINWAYAPEETTPTLPYEYFWISARLGYQLPGLQKGIPLSMNHFAAVFSGSTDQVLVVQYTPPSCLRILDPLYDAKAPLLPSGMETLPTETESAWFALPRNTARALSLSAPVAWISDGAPPPVPEWLFGQEPEHRWCYYFQKADLARQMGNWEKVARLGDQAFAAPYFPDDPAEYLPFIEAYGRLGRLAQAQKLTEKVADLNPALRPMLCAAWRRIQPTASSDEVEVIQITMQNLECSE
ncbi:MAG: hypothetical protein Fur0043_08380 [Anaerolineales bacterium]